MPEPESGVSSPRSESENICNWPAGCPPREVLMITNGKRPRLRLERGASGLVESARPRRGQRNVGHLAPAGVVAKNVEGERGICAQRTTAGDVAANSVAAAT